MHYDLAATRTRNLLNGNVRGLAHATRYNPYVMTKETVSDHSYWVCLYTFCLYEWMKETDPDLAEEIDFYKLMGLAVTHDLPEALTGDINRSIKKRDLTLENLWKDGEVALWEANVAAEHLPPSLVDWVCSAVYEKDSPEHTLMKLADDMSVASFMAEQSLMGNTYQCERVRKRLEPRFREKGVKLGTSPCSPIEEWCARRYIETADWLISVASSQRNAPTWLRLGP